MMEIAKLIQKATDTTNNLFENSNNFKFRVRNEAGSTLERQTSNKKPQSNQGPRKNIKINDPFKHAEQKL